MDRLAEVALAGDGSSTNIDICTCELCGVDLGPGDARLSRCRGCSDPEHNVPDPSRHDEPRGGIHARCRDARCCGKRQAQRSMSKKERAKQARAAAPQPIVTYRRRIGGARPP